MNRNEFKQKLFTIHEVKNTKGQLYHSIQIKGSRIFFVKEGNCESEYIDFDILYNLYINENEINTKIAKKYISEKVLSPAVAIMRKILEISISEAISKMINWLPFDRRNNLYYIKALESKFSEYIQVLNKIKESDFSPLFQDNGKQLTKKKFISLIDKIQKTIHEIIDVYYHGYPDKAYKYLDDLLKGKKIVSPKATGANRYLSDSLENFFLFELKQEGSNLYRMRISKEILSKKELFHVPFQDREKVSTARFSISGVPSLYLGTSLRVCLNETGKPKKNKKVFACRFQNHRSVALINLVIPDLNEILKDKQSIFNFLVTYPFYVSCLGKVQYPEHPFKPEYIVPQLLSQYVMRRQMFNGIKYSSTKDRACVGDKFNNLVIPTSKLATDGYCQKIKECYFLTEPIVVDLSDIDKSEDELKRLDASAL